MHARNRCDDCARQDQSDPLNRLICAVDRNRIQQHRKHLLLFGLGFAIFVGLLIEIAFQRGAF